MDAYPLQASLSPSDDQSSLVSKCHHSPHRMAEVACTPHLEACAKSGRAKVPRMASQGKVSVRVNIRKNKTHLCWRQSKTDALLPAEWRCHWGAVRYHQSRPVLSPNAPSSHGVQFCGIIAFFQKVVFCLGRSSGRPCNDENTRERGSTSVQKRDYLVEGGSSEISVENGRANDGGQVEEYKLRWNNDLERSSQLVTK